MKVAKTYPTLLLGVSQQVEHARVPGQHSDQVNLWPDPVMGLTRRHGTRAVGFINSAVITARMADNLKFVHKYGGHEVVLFIPRQGSAGPALLAFDKTDADRSPTDGPRRSVDPVTPGGSSS